MMAIIFFLKALLGSSCILSLSVISNPMWRFRSHKSAVNALQSPEFHELTELQCIGKKSSMEKTLVRPSITRRKSFLSKCASNIKSMNPQTITTKQNKIKMSADSTEPSLQDWSLTDSLVYSRPLTKKVHSNKKKMITEDEWYALINDQETSATLDIFTPCLFQLSTILSVAKISDKFKAKLSASLETRWSKTSTSKLEQSLIEIIYDMAKKRVLGTESKEAVRASRGDICTILDKFAITSNDEAKKELEDIVKNLTEMWHNIEEKMHLEQMPSHGVLFEEWDKAGQVIVNCFKLLSSACLVYGKTYEDKIKQELSLMGKRVGDLQILNFFYTLTKELMIQPKNSRLAYYELKRDEFLKGLERDSDVVKSTESLLRRTYRLQKDLRLMLQDVDDEDPIFPIGIHVPIDLFEEADQAPEVHASTFRTLRSVSMPNNLKNSPSSST
ncbi:hypothetical protein DFH28DRAFT_963175 [Melampsora americana]|nr:hypothetical protein DFH28DRAFT_963175 [Melampsora americana]